MLMITETLEIPEMRAVPEILETRGSRDKRTPLGHLEGENPMGAVIGAHLSRFPENLLVLTKTDFLAPRGLLGGNRRPMREMLVHCETVLRQPLMPVEMRSPIGRHAIINRTTRQCHLLGSQRGKGRR